MERQCARTGWARYVLWTYLLLCEDSVDQRILELLAAERARLNAA
jgi:hypothetical protein